MTDELAERRNIKEERDKYKAALEKVKTHVDVIFTLPIYTEKGACPYGQILAIKQTIDKVLEKGFVYKPDEPEGGLPKSG